MPFVHVSKSTFFYAVLESKLDIFWHICKVIFKLKLMKLSGVEFYLENIKSNGMLFFLGGGWEEGGSKFK